MSESKPVTGFISIFESKIKAQKELIKKELDKPKKERNKYALKQLLKDTNQLQKRIKAVKKYTTTTCPHCGGEL